MYARMPKPGWRTKAAACASDDYDPDWWFAHADSVVARLARDICKTECPLLEQCRSYAFITNEQNGVWGGMSPQERRRLAGSVHGNQRAAKKCEPKCEHCTAGEEIYHKYRGSTRETIGDIS